MWEAVERFHGLTYTAPEVRSEATAAGLKGFWMAYFSGRIAPLGPVSAQLVASTFFYYGPARVDRAIPDAWSYSSPDKIIEARYRGMDQALRRVYGEQVDSPIMAEAAELTAEATALCSPIGRAIHAGWASLPRPTEPHLALWHDCTVLREYRSGNHLMAICNEGLDGVESVVSHVAVDQAPRAWITDEAGWLPEDEAAAVERLQSRGWLDDAGAATDECRAGRQRIEDMTDRLDYEVWGPFGEANGRRLFALLAELAASLPADDQLDWREIYADH